MKRQLFRPTSPASEASTVGTKFLEWKQLGGDVLSALGVPELSDGGYEGTFSRHMAYCQSRGGSMDSEFRKGMLAGASLTMKSYQEQQLWPNVAVAASWNMNNTAQGFTNNSQWNQGAAPSSLSAQVSTSQTYFNQPQQQPGFLHNMQAPPLAQNYAVGYVPCYYPSAQYSNNFIPPNYPPLPVPPPVPLPVPLPVPPPVPPPVPLPVPPPPQSY